MTSAIVASLLWALERAEYSGIYIPDYIGRYCVLERWTPDPYGEPEPVMATEHRGSMATVLHAIESDQGMPLLKLHFSCRCELWCWAQDVRFD